MGKGLDRWLVHNCTPISEEAYIEIGAPEWVWLAFQEELKEYFNIPDEDSSDEAPSVCSHCRMAGMEVVGD